MTTELVVLAPIVIVLLLLVVGLGRYAHGKQLVEQAAAAAARAASLTSTAAQANTQAQRAASGSLADAGVSCTGMTTDRRYRVVPARRGGDGDDHLHRRPLRHRDQRPPRNRDVLGHRPRRPGSPPAVRHPGDRS